MSKTFRLALAVTAGLLGGMSLSAHAEDRYYDHATNSWKSADQAPSRRMSQSMRKPARQFMRTTVSIDTR